MLRWSRSALIFLALLWVTTHYALPSVRAAEESGYYPGKLRIEKARNLAKEEREVEARFAQYLEQHTEEAIALYQKHYGKELNTDNARELSKDYAPGGIEANDPKTKAARAAWANAVQEPSSALVKEIYRRELEKPAPADKLNRVVFTAGGTAAGKTTAIKGAPQVANVVDHAQTVYDTTLSNLKSATARIEQAISAGKSVSIVYVHRDPVEAFVNGALPRAEKTGRTIPLEAYLRTHTGAPRVLLDIAQRYKDDARLAIAVIDNSRGLGKAAAVDLEFVKTIVRSYKTEELKAKLVRALEEAYEKGKRGEKGGISEVVYRGFKGHAS